MPAFKVDVDGTSYRVEAPDENTAWSWANQTHRAEQVKLEEAGKAKGGEFKIGAEGFKPAAEQVAKETGFGGRFMQGVGETFDRYAYGLEGLWRDLKPEERARLEQNRIQADVGGTAATLGQAAGDVAISAPALLAAPAAAPVVAARAPVLARAMASLPGRVVGTLAPNAALGALSAPEDRAAGAAYGAVGGAVGAGVNRAVGGLVKPFVSEGAEELIRQGVQPTPGQAIGGAVGKMEEKLGSIPLVGDIIGRSRNRAINEFNEALAGRTAQHLTGETGLPRAAGRKLGDVGDEALLKLRAQIGQTYEDVLASVPKLRIEREAIESEVAKIMNDASLDLSEQSAKRLADYAEKHLMTPRSNIMGEITGETAKRIESDMGKAATRARTSSVGEERAYGEALDRLHAFWREGVSASMPPEKAALLKRANEAWRGFLPQDAAAAMASSQTADKQGVFTPRVLRSALARGDKSQSDNVLRGLQQQPVANARTPYEYAASMSRAGRDLGNVVPDSGTTPRALAAGLLPTVGYMNPVATIAGGSAAAAATAAAYSRMGSALLTRGAFPATREAVTKWLVSQKIPPELIPVISEQILAGTARAQRPLPRSMRQLQAR